MTVYAEPADVRATYPTQSPDTLIRELISRTSARLDALVPSLAQRVADEAINPVLAKDVVCAAVVRVLRNPQGYTTQSAGPYAGVWGAGVNTTGAITFPLEDLHLLAPSTSAQQMGPITSRIPAWRRP